MGSAGLLAFAAAAIDTLIGTFDSTHNPFSYPVPPNSMPKQETSPVHGTPSGGATPTARPAATASSRRDTVRVVTGGKPRSRIASTVDAAQAARAERAAHRVE